VASGLSAPVYVTAPPGDSSRLFIVEQGSSTTSAGIKILDLATRTVASTPFLNLGAEVSVGGERGLLGMAFHPNYATNRKFYINFTASDGDTVIREYQASASNAGLADLTTGRQILRFDRNATNHNGGWIGFGPNDGYLYIASGDSGGSNDQNDAAQNLADLRGKILRLNVDADDFGSDADRNYAIPAGNPFAGATTGADEIWAYGLRNPWRPSFDRSNGDLWIADVGQDAREEINYQPHAAGGGQNYGWDSREGTLGTKPTGAIDPIFDYVHDSSATPAGGFSITGGYVYRGPITALQGKYFFGDFVSERIWSLLPTSIVQTAHDGTNYTGFQEWTSTLAPGGGLSIDSIASFGEDALGNLYIVDRGGEVFRIVPEPGALSLLSISALLLARRRRRN
jgi:glucose/arabinose dehydrogenase